VAQLWSLGHITRYGKSEVSLQISDCTRLCLHRHCARLEHLLLGLLHFTWLACDFRTYSYCVWRPGTFQRGDICSHLLARQQAFKQES
jgi:hypothetical protein